MDDLTNTAFLRRPDLHVETQGEFAGWRTWSRDSFESNNGPFWHRMDDDGRVRKGLLWRISALSRALLWGPCANGVCTSRPDRI